MEKPNIRHLKDPILLVEDTVDVQEILSDLLNSLEIEFAIAQNGQEALELIQKQNFSIFITDLHMPLMDGQSLLKEIKKKIPDAIVIVETGDRFSEIIIDIMKMGAFDYLIKPYSIEQFQKILLKSIEYKYLQDSEKYHSLNSSLKLRNHIEWLNYKETHRTYDKEGVTVKALNNLKSSLVQGGGFGSLLTSLDLLKYSAKKTENGILVKEELFNLLIESREIAVQQLNAIIQISDVLDKKINLIIAESNEILNLILTLQNITELFKEKSILFNCSNPKNNYKIRIDKENLLLAIEELLINAYKYTNPHGKVSFMMYITDGYFTIAVKNDIPSQNSIPREYERLVIEPFFRLVSLSDESICKFEKFGLGLGLTVVDNIVRKHNGIFYIHQVKDYTEKDTKDCILAEILLPIVQ